jgi:hypothetical protein
MLNIQKVFTSSFDTYRTGIMTSNKADTTRDSRLSVALSRKAAVIITVLDGTTHKKLRFF